VNWEAAARSGSKCLSSEGGRRWAGKGREALLAICQEQGNSKNR
jgi:hypothetical protein